VTPRQGEVLITVALYIQRHGCAPTIAEVAESLGVTVVRAQQHLTVLRAEGYMTHQGSYRSLRLLRCAVCGAELVACPACRCLGVTCGDEDCRLALLDAEIPRVADP